MGALAFKAVSVKDKIRRSLARLAEPHRLYTAVAGVFGLIFVFLTPPAGAGDEPRHFERMYEVATGQWLGAEGAPAGILAFADRTKDQLESGEPYSPAVRDALQSIELQRYAIEPYARPLEIVLRIHHPVAYLPYAPAIWIGLAFDLAPAQIFTLCRLTTWLIGLLIMRQALRIMPSHRHLAAFVALLPTPVFYLGAANIDAFLTALGFLFFALVARHADSADRPVTGREIAILAAVAFGVSIMKTPYAMLPFLAILIPAAKFRSPAHRFRALGLIVAPGLAAAVVWAVVVKTFMLHGLAYGTPAGSYVQPSEQLAHILANPAGFATTLFRTFFMTDTPVLAAVQAIGLLGWNNVALPIWVYAMCFTTLVILWTSASPAPRAIGSPQGRAATTLIFSTVVLGAFFFLYLQWSAVGADTISGFQGRYLLPLAPLLFALAPFRTTLLKARRVRVAAVASVSTLSLAAGLHAVIGTFYS